MRLTDEPIIQALKDGKGVITPDFPNKPVYCDSDGMFYTLRESGAPKQCILGLDDIIRNDWEIVPDEK